MTGTGENLCATRSITYAVYTILSKLYVQNEMTEEHGRALQILKVIKWLLKPPLAII